MTIEPCLFFVSSLFSYTPFRLINQASDEPNNLSPDTATDIMTRDPIWVPSVIVWSLPILMSILVSRMPNHPCLPLEM